MAQNPRQVKLVFRIEPPGGTLESLYALFLLSKVDHIRNHTQAISDGAGYLAHGFWCQLSRMTLGVDSDVDEGKLNQISSLLVDMDDNLREGVQGQSAAA
ncbi:MAG: hypothetical protein V3T55_12135, partial [Anaerolineales bacterium]